MPELKLPEIIGPEIFSLNCSNELTAEIVHRYNTYHNRTGLDIQALRFNHVSSELDLAVSVLESAGFTRCDNGNWKPPLGKPAGPLLDSLDAEREAKNTLAAMILDLTGAALPHMPTDESLRVAGVKAITAALNVMQGRQP